MDKSYFDKDYFVGGTKSAYHVYGVNSDLVSRCQLIIDKYKPKRLLEVGCAYGYYVAQFRAMGVDAYGIDLSPWAISQACELAKDYVFEADARNIPFPNQFFDLVISWDTLEHIPEDDSVKMIDELRRVGQRQFHFIATIALEGDLDKSHVNIKPLEWWVERFPDADLGGTELMVVEKEEEDKAIALGGIQI